MKDNYLLVKKSKPLDGAIWLSGAKNSVLVVMASMLLSSGISTLTNVPASRDVYSMIELLESLGAVISFDENASTLVINTSTINYNKIPEKTMKKMRASVLVMGPLLARLKRAEIVMPGGCSIGARPLDLHFKAFRELGVNIQYGAQNISADYTNPLVGSRIVFDYPSVGATENALMLAVLMNKQQTTLINAALEPEVLNLIQMLKEMGAKIEIKAPATIEIVGVEILNAISHEIMPDRLEAGTFLLAAAITGGNITLRNAPLEYMDIFSDKLREMGHEISMDLDNRTISLSAKKRYRGVSFKTMPYPGFPTDLQAPMMAVLSLAEGSSIIHETVFENRLQHVEQLNMLSAQIVKTDHVATISGVKRLVGAVVDATDIRAGAALVLAGLVAEGQTIVREIHHIERGYDRFVEKLKSVGANIEYIG